MTTSLILSHSVELAAAFIHTGNYTIWWRDKVGIPSNRQNARKNTSGKMVKWVYASNKECSSFIQDCITQSSIMILSRTLQLLRHHINQSLSSQKTPHDSPSHVSYAVSIVCIFFSEHWLHYNGSVLYDNDGYACISSLLHQRNNFGIVQSYNNMASILQHKQHVHPKVTSVFSLSDMQYHPM